MLQHLLTYCANLKQKINVENHILFSQWKCCLLATEQCLLLLEMGAGKKIHTKDFQKIPKSTDFPLPSFAIFDQSLQFGSYLDKWLTFGIFQLSLISQKDVWANENTLARVWYLQPENLTLVTQFYYRSQDTANINALCPLAQGISISQFLRRLLLTIPDSMNLQKFKQLTLLSITVSTSPLVVPRTPTVLLESGFWKPVSRFVLCKRTWTALLSTGVNGKAVFLPWLHLSLILYSCSSEVTLRYSVRWQGAFILELPTLCIKTFKKHYFHHRGGRGKLSIICRFKLLQIVKHLIYGYRRCLPLHIMVGGLHILFFVAPILLQQVNCGWK